MRALKSAHESLIFVSTATCSNLLLLLVYLTILLVILCGWSLILVFAAWVFHQKYFYNDLSFLIILVFDIARKQLFGDYILSLFIRTYLTFILFWVIILVLLEKLFCVIIVLSNFVYFCPVCEDKITCHCCALYGVATCVSFNWSEVLKVKAQMDNSEHRENGRHKLPQGQV